MSLDFTHGTWRHRCPGAINGRTSTYLWIPVPLGEPCDRCQAVDPKPGVRPKFKKVQQMRHALTAKVTVEVPRDDVAAVRAFAKDLRDRHIDRHTGLCQDDRPHVPTMRNKRLWCARCKTYL